MRFFLKGQEDRRFITGGSDSPRRLFLLMSVHSESFLSLVSCYLMLLSLSSARHSNAPYLFPYGINVITGLFCFFSLELSSSYLRYSIFLFSELKHYQNSSLQGFMSPGEKMQIFDSNLNCYFENQESYCIDSRCSFVLQIINV